MIATEPIPKGEIVAVLGGIIVPKKDIHQYRDKMGHVGIQIDDDFFICPATREELEGTGVFNHSCNPNVGYHGNAVIVHAIRDIKKGEELCFDYAFVERDFEEFACKCGSNNCRKIIKPTDWENPEIQKRFGQYYSPYLKKKIR